MASVDYFCMNTFVNINLLDNYISYFKPPAKQSRKYINGYHDLYKPSSDILIERCRYAAVLCTWEVGHYL